MNSHFVSVEELPQPGEMRRIEAFGQRVLLANVEENIHAVADTCSHEDASLSIGALKTEECTVKCPLHGSRFCLRTGEALDEPAELPIEVFRVEKDPNGILLIQGQQ